MAQRLTVVIAGDTSDLDRALKKAGGSASKFGGLAKTAFLGVGAGLAAVGVAALKAAGDYQESLNTFQAVSGATGDQMKEVSALAKKLGADIKLPGTSAKDAASAMTELAKGGLSVKDSMSAARGVLQLSAAAQIDNAEAATITARALNSFGLAGKDASRVADLLAAASNASTAEISDLALGMQAASAVFRQGHQSIDDLTTSLGLMANAGIVGQDAGTSLKTMMLALEAPTAKAAAVMKDMGVNVRDAHGTMKPMRDLIDAFSPALKKMSDAQRDAALKTIFGTDAIRAGNIILAQGTGAWDKMHTAVEQQGAAADLAAAKMKGFNGAIDGLKSAAETLLISIGTPLLGAATVAANALSALVGWIDKIAGAKNMEAKIKVTVEGLESAAKKIDEFLFGKTIHIRGMDFGGMETVQTQGLVDKIAAAMERVDWQSVGASIAKGIDSAIKLAQAQSDKSGRWAGEQLSHAIGQGIENPASLAHIAGGLAKITGQLLIWNAKIAYLPERIGLQFVMAFARGISGGVGDVVGAVGRMLSALGATISGWAGSAYAYAFKIGSSIVHGVIDGIGNLAGAVGNAISSGISAGISAAGSILHGSGDFMATKHLIGEPLAQGVIEGYILGSAALPDKMKDSIKNAIEAARTAIEAARGVLSNTWGNLSSDAGTAFDAIAKTIRTKTEKIIDAEDLKRQYDDLQAGVEKAQTDLATAMAGGDPEAIKTAQKALDDALWTQTRFALERQAEEERKQLDARNALRRRHFDEALADLQTSLAKHGATHAEAQAAILKLLASYGVNYKDAGTALGTAFAQGLRESMADVIDAAEAIAKEVAKRLKLKSPAEEGPLASLDTWWAKLGTTLASGVDKSAVSATLNTAVSPSGIGVGAGGGVTVNFYGTVTDERSVEDLVTKAVLKANRRGSLLAADLA